MNLVQVLPRPGPGDVIVNDEADVISETRVSEWLISLGSGGLPPDSQAFTGGFSSTPRSRTRRVLIQVIHAHMMSGSYGEHVEPVS